MGALYTYQSRIGWKGICTISRPTARLLAPRRRESSTRMLFISSLSSRELWLSPRNTAFLLAMYFRAPSGVLFRSLSPLKLNTEVPLMPSTACSIAAAASSSSWLTEMAGSANFGNLAAVTCIPPPSAPATPNPGSSRPPIPAPAATALLLSQAPPSSLVACITNRPLAPSMPLQLPAFVAPCPIPCSNPVPAEGAKASTSPTEHARITASGIRDRRGLHA
mmetsp:Transcript_49253/g.118129  ORF Transcript_49253/g.118129 Transcript_49253/m.118129 type:complete len:221 (-) Transcript_49253:197-859(-)